MADSYLEKLADILVDYSLGEVDFAEAWKNGQKRLMVTYESVADELARLVTERVLDGGGNVFLDMLPSWYLYTYYTRASGTVLRSKPIEALKRLDHIAALLAIRSETNTRSLATVDPKRIAARNTAVKPYVDRVYGVDEKGDFLTPWCITLFPTEAYAQDMEMPYSEYQEYVWKIMLLDLDDPVKAWLEVAKKQRELKEKVLEGCRTIRIVDEEDETDLKMSVERHRWITSEGKTNFPSDEIFNAPRKNSVQGTITFPKLPQYYRSGPEVGGIKLTFKDGKVVNYRAEVGQDYLDNFFKENPGATSLGEVALGLHPRIQRISRQILFDEKIGGTIHIAFGSAHRRHVLGDEDKSQLNEASVHWDMIRDMRKSSAYVAIDEKYKLTWNSERGRWTISSIHS